MNSSKTHSAIIPRFLKNLTKIKKEILNDFSEIFPKCFQNIFQLLTFLQRISKFL